MVWPSPERETVTLFTGSAKLELPTTDGIELMTPDNLFEPVSYTHLDAADE